MLTDSCLSMENRIILQRAGTAWMSNQVELCDMNPVVNNCVVYNNCICEELLYCDLMEGVAHGDLHGGAGACDESGKTYKNGAGSAAETVRYQ